jgi:coenzyme F420 hydrogenase subunit beta
MSELHRLEFAGPAPHRNLCTDCGVSRSRDPQACGRVCQFIRPDYPAMEQAIHGRRREGGDEAFFGVSPAMWRARLKSPAAGAQWTGITTRLAELALRNGLVEAVLTVTADAEDRWKPIPVLVTRAEDMAACRGMRMGYAPLLGLLDRVAELGIERLAVIAIPCQVYALRALQSSLQLTRLYVIGTPCSDNTTTEHFHQFLSKLDDQPERINYLEFRADYHVEVRYEDGRQREIPFLQLPLSDLPNNFFPLTCRTCVDYVNSLADITVGYMAGEGQQWLIVRNQRGDELLSLLESEVSLEALGSRGRRRSSVVGYMKNLQRAAGGLPVRAMPNWLRPLVSWLMPRIGPRGLEFARARLEMKALETVLHLQRERPKKLHSMVPEHVWDLVRPYGLERNRPSPQSVRGEVSS